MTQPSDPYLSFRFSVEIDGIEQARFTECSPPKVTTAVFPYAEGGLNDYEHKLPGKTTLSNFTLKRGLTDSSALWDWYSRFLSKKDRSSELKHVSIIQYDGTGAQVYKWDLEDAFPMRWEGPTFTTTSSAMSFETLEIAFAGMTTVKGA
ncbi:MAG TPA: phage tail protein [Tepidiformaceae bacterium]|nr:phage tail protein [Tepidiformaceae bacterium]